MCFDCSMNSRSVILFSVVLIIVCGCGKQETELERLLRFSQPLANGYYYYDSRERRLLKKLPSGEFEGLISGRFDTYVQVDSIVYVARRPYITIEGNNGAKVLGVSAACEILRSDTEVDETILLDRITSEVVPARVKCFD